MLLPASFGAALVLSLFAMFCWGSWTNTWRVAEKWRLELYYCDYSIGVLLAAVAAALTGGLLFLPPDFTDNLRAAEPAAFVYAAAGGMALNLGNFFLMAGIARVGMTVAFPISVGFSLVVSTVLSYWIHPQGNEALLAAGVGLVFLAVLTNSIAYGSGARKANARGGLGMCFAAGVLFSASGPLVAKALTLPRALAPYGAGILFASGSLVAAGLLFLYLLRRPLDGIPFSARDYAAGSARNHLAGLAGGLIWGAGMVATFLAAGLAGMAVSAAVAQANPLVASAWGIFIWREFRGAPLRTYFVLALMIALYATGLLLLALSVVGADHRC